MIAINCFPDCLKNMQSGMIKSIGLQKKALKFSFVGNWVICLILIYVFTFCKTPCLHFEFGLKGLWMAKLSADIYIVLQNSILLKFDRDSWEAIAEDFYLKRQGQLENFSAIDNKNDKFSPLNDIEADTDTYPSA